MQVRTESPTEYRVNPSEDVQAPWGSRPISAVEAADNKVINKALQILATRLENANDILGSPADVRAYLQLTVALKEHEVFGVLWLNARNQLIEVQEIFRGTIHQTSVYPREVVKVALAHNASAAILYHNHPSGHAEPSQADILLTNTLRDTLGLVDVRVLDHLVITAAKVTSFAERGLL